MDIDIDIQPGTDIGQIFGGALTKASMVQDGKLVRHPVGWYGQTIPVDPVTGLSAIPYKQAGQFGYTKIDLLNLHVLAAFDSKEEVRRLARTEPDWKLMYDKEVVEQLFHLHDHYDLVSRLHPSSVSDVADILALLRPGKRHLIQQYELDKVNTSRELYERNSSDDGYTYKRCQAIAYAHIIVLQLHLIKQGRVSTDVRSDFVL